MNPQPTRVVVNGVTGPDRHTILQLADVREISFDFRKQIVRIIHSEGAAEFDLQAVKEINDKIHEHAHSIMIT